MLCLQLPYSVPIDPTWPNNHLMHVKRIWVLAKVSWFFVLKSVQCTVVYEKVLAWSTRANDLQGTHDSGFHALSVSYMVLLQLIVNKNVIFSKFYDTEKGGGRSLVAVKEIVQVNNSS